jgi:hypothetical protein
VIYKTKKEDMMTKNINAIKVGDELININGVSCSGVVAFVMAANLQSLPSKNGRLVYVALTDITKKNGAPYCIYAKSKNACLEYDVTGSIIDVGKSQITIR